MDWRAKLPTIGINYFTLIVPSAKLHKILCKGINNADYTPNQARPLSAETFRAIFKKDGSKHTLKFDSEQFEPDQVKVRLRNFRDHFNIHQSLLTMMG